MVGGREERTASLSSRNLGISSRRLGSRGQIKPHLYDWENMSCAVDIYNLLQRKTLKRRVNTLAIKSILELPFFPLRGDENRLAPSGQKPVPRRVKLTIL
jgi:hypothetical protein